jgi:hypothetical protein
VDLAGAADRGGGPLERDLELVSRGGGALSSEPRQGFLDLPVEPADEVRRSGVGDLDAKQGGARFHAGMMVRNPEAGIQITET